MPQTGATRYQKFLKSEKSKTKLKNKKELPKGTNVTKTNFKIKKIVIKEQLKKHGESEALSSRKLNLKELMSRLNHFNVHSRTDALDGLRELITSHSDVLERNLGQLINGVTPLLMNVEKAVRRETLKVLHLILSNVVPEKTEPFFDIMCTYLRSAMTHIDSRIQEDSLLFLDILLLCTPERIAKDFHKIIPNFLDMISKLRVDSKPGRTLTVNLDSQITSAKWRVKVLHRLQQFLHKYIDCNHITTEDTRKANESVRFDESKLNYYPVTNPNYTSVCHLPCFMSKNSQDQSQDEIEQFKTYIETLVPLLFETWLEVCPASSKEQNMDTVLTEDAAGLLKHTLEVLALIWELIKYLDKKNPSSNLTNFFLQKYKQSFTKHIFQSFPYVCNIKNRSKSANTSQLFEDLITDSKLVNENLEICHLFISFNPHVNIKSQKAEVSSLLNYIERTFNHNTQDHVSDRIIKILHTMFAQEINSWTRNLNTLDTLFKKIIWAYFNQDLSSSFRQKIFALLCQITLNDKLSHFHKSEAYESWLTNLPDILLEETITSQTIDIIFKFAVQNNKVFNSVIRPKLLSILENLPTIKVSDSATAVYKLYSLLYWIKCWDNDSLNLIEKQLVNNVYSGDSGKYIFDTLQLRSELNSQ
ncbi:testis-expressed protein 10 homolog [Plutella xylostella]|uniref:testis-expressed protein 10 homolog n=1 Tax=Plutella xylostella TaxID=51655 RepID=UPI0020327438|nr:testis-expressed protein 10 homolog [Plutella xylostella]